MCRKLYLWLHRGSDNEAQVDMRQLVKKLSGGSTAALAVVLLASKLHGLLKLGAEIDSGNPSIRRNLGQIGTKKHQRKVGKGLKH